MIKDLMYHILDSTKKRHIILMVFDILCYAAVSVFYYFIALTAANSMPVNDVMIFFVNAIVQLGTVLVCRHVFGTYKNVWRYSNTRAYFNLVIADACGGLSALAVIRLFNKYFTGLYYGLWQAATIGALTALVTLMSRFTYCLIYKTSKTKSTKPRVPVVIAGAGRLGSYLAGDLHNNRNSGYEPIFFIDTDKAKIGNRVSGLKVYDEETAHRLMEKLGIRDVIISITNKNGAELADLYYYYRNDLGCKVRVYDSLVNDSKNQKGVLREFSIEDLLFRKPRDVSDEATLGFYGGKTVLITGGGGSIGSEICRQIAKCAPRQLIIFDIYENNAYDIQQELIRTYGDTLDLSVEIGSVRDADRLDEVFRRYRPEVVFHAAAHKHVPLMENNGAEAIKNNCMGTYNAANAAEKYGAERFILISTDKAVNPTNIMGASKRVCEMIIQCRTDSSTRFAAVRFGNVLGSNGSVIPLFKRQIAEGGPVTITDKRIIRYFMTISEASQLVILAGAMAEKGELFVLDMGKPVKIYELAKTLIQLSGLEPDRDIMIEEIGLRPGEKLYEELLMKAEQLDKTENDMIFVERDQPCTRAQVEEKLALLMEAVRGGADLKAAMAAVVPTYRAPGEVNRDAESSEEMQLVGVTR